MGRVKGLKEFVVKSVVKGLLFFFLVARHWDAHTPTFTLDNFPQMFGLTLLDSLNCYTTDKHGQRGRASQCTKLLNKVHGLQIRYNWAQQWTPFVCWKSSNSSAALNSTKSSKPSKVACSLAWKKYSSFVTERLEVKCQPRNSENNKYKIYFLKLYKVYLCMLISFSIKCSKHYSATFSTQKGSMPNKRSLFYSLDTFFRFHLRWGKRGFIFKHFCFFFSH